MSGVAAGADGVGGEIGEGGVKEGKGRLVAGEGAEEAGEGGGAETVQGEGFKVVEAAGRSLEDVSEG